MEDTGSEKLIVRLTANQKLDISVKTFNLENEIERRIISLNNTDYGELQLEMKIMNPDKPYIIVLADVDNPDHRWEFVGAMVDPEF